MASEKETAWLAYRAAWNEKGSMSTMSDLEEKTARRHFEEYWDKHYHE